MSRHKRKKAKSRRARKAPQRKKSRSTRRSRRWELVPVDSEAVRRKVLGNYRRARTTYRKAEKTWSRHFEEENPAYNRWVRRSCGPAIARVRELVEKINHRSHVLHLLHWERWRTGLGMRACYERVLDRLEHPERYPEEEAPFGFEPDDAEEMGPEEEEAHAGDAGDWEALMADLEAMLGEDFEAFFGAAPGEESHASEEPSDASAGHRLKQVYRQLVRRLHPDLNHDLCAEKEQIWHRVQEAYRAGDLDTLQVLQTHEELVSGSLSRATPVSHIIALTEDYRRVRRSVRNALRRARQQPSWGFLDWSQREQREHLLFVQDALETEAGALSERLSWVEDEIARWEKRPTPRCAKEPRKSKTDPYQRVFDFC